METIRVNMTPCEDIKTIHASQNDNEGREWGFELHNNGEKIDSSSISDQLVFKAYEGGTEEILPTNGSTPTTSPFKGDIRYPQGLLSDQEFLYRESPTEEDGNAKIKSLYGNTLVWNQLAENGNFADGVGRWTAGDSNTLTVTDGVCKIQSTNTSGSNHHLVFPDPSIFQNGHTYLLRCEARAYGNMIGGSIFFAQQTNYINIGTIEGLESLTSAWQSGYLLFSRNDFTLTNGKRIVIGSLTTVTTDDYFELKNICVFDLTQMGLDISSPSDFTSLFSLPYYSYNQGTLLSFMGNGIKTVSKNQFDTSVVTTSYAGLTLTTSNGTIRAVYSGGSQYAGFNFYGNPVFTDTFLKGRYRLSFDVSGLDTQWTVGLRQGAYFVGTQAVAISNDGHYSFTIDTEANPNCYLSFARTGNKTTAYDVTFSNIQLELGTTETSYTPFEEQTISLPISQYFPDGMDGVGTAYDELTNSGYAKRMGQVDLGLLTWYYTNGLFLARISDGAYTGSVTGSANGLCSLYEAKAVNPTSLADKQMTLGTAYAFANVGNIVVKDSSYTSASAFKQAMQGVILKYELATPLENYGIVDLGTLTWTYQSANTRFYATISDMPLAPVRTLTFPNPLYMSLIGGSISSTTDMVVYNGGNERRIYIHNLSYTNASDFKSAMSGVYLLYEKQNPQGFTTASLVTENGETPLSNEDGVLIGKCTEQLSSESGFFDAKIKLADEDGECYSNKIQLHIERSPQ